MAKKKTQQYPEAFRNEAVRLTDQSDRTAVDVAKELGIHPDQIYNWRSQFNIYAKNQFKTLDGVDYSKDESAEVRKLKKEVARLKEESM